MKIGIYKGDIVGITDASGKLTYIVKDGETYCVSKDSILQVSDDDFKTVEPEFKAIKEEIKNITARIHRLDAEYQRKKELLREMLLEARRKENAIIGRLIKASMPEVQVQEGEIITWQ